MVCLIKVVIFALISIYCLVEIEVDNYNEINEITTIKSKFKLNHHYIYLITITNY